MLQPEQSVHRGGCHFVHNVNFLNETKGRLYFSTTYLQFLFDLLTHNKNKGLWVSVNMKLI